MFDGSDSVAIGNMIKSSKTFKTKPRICLDIYKKELEALIQELIKIEAADFIDK